MIDRSALLHPASAASYLHLLDKIQIGKCELWKLNYHQKQQTDKLIIKGYLTAATAACLTNALFVALL